MKQFIVHAFTEELFHGNPAAVCVLEQWLPEETMMSITRENRLSETAFTVREPDGYRLRWLTPGGEIDLCGHATLATASVLLDRYETDKESLTFHTLSGDLTVRRGRRGLLEMDFPAYDLKRISVTRELEEAIGARPVEAYLGRDLLCFFKESQQIAEAKPDMEKVKQLPGLLLHITAEGEQYTCVSRSFAPKLKIDEDPVCGSGHCHIAPYWCERLDRDEITAYQASERGGVLYCRTEKDRVPLAGHTVLFSEAELYL